MGQGAALGEDGLRRCPWGVNPPEYRRYHDQEWGRPVADDQKVLEKLCLEGFQSGLSWLTILRKRDSFRRAFLDFDAAAVAALGEVDVQRLLLDAGIVRHRGKILATIDNARATVRLLASGGSLAAVCWGYEPRQAPTPVTTDDLVASTDESTALSRALRQLGFRFVGPTTVHAAMQSLGMVNDHLADCSIRAAVEAERNRFSRPAAAGPRPVRALKAAGDG
ncbi:MAG: DNA-3-methyladenine glycosylase I [Candidatus Dormibacteria bacterium]